MYKYSYNGVELAQLTSGNYDVLNYYGCDNKGNHYYQSTKGGAINRIISKIDIKKGDIDISPIEGCASVEFSPMMNYYVENYSNSTTPPCYTLYDSKTKNKSP